MSAMRVFLHFSLWAAGLLFSNGSLTERAEYRVSLKGIIRKKKLERKSWRKCVKHSYEMKGIRRKIAWRNI